MANQNQNQNQNQGQNQGQTKAPKFLIQASSVVDENNLNVRLRTSKNGVPEEQEVIVFRNHAEVDRFTTNSSGFYNYVKPITKTSKKQTILFEFFLVGNVASVTVVVEIPEITVAPKEDAQKVVLMRLSTNGAFKVFIRVLKPQGYGMETDVSILYRNKRHVVKTDSAGLFTFNVPGTIVPGDNFPLQAIVNGIEDVATIRISRPRVRIPGPARMSARWFFRTNNGRAFILLCLAGFFWLFAILIGVGKPVFHENIFRGDNGLSKQEMLHNRVMEQAYGNNNAFVIQPTEVKGQWHHNIWKAAIILTLVFLVYGPLSLREEIAEEISLAVENMRDREYAQAGDPWFEKLVAWTGSYAVARNRNLAVSATTSSQTTEASTDKKSGWGNFPMLLASDAIVEIVPAIVRAMFHR